MNISPGKRKGLTAVSNQRGVIAALAIDQRSALRDLIGKVRGVPAETVPPGMLVEFKEAVSRILTPYASAILLDPEFGLPAARKRAPNAGLLLAYEESGYQHEVPGRLPRLLPGFSAARLVEEGADCIKVLLYYSPLSTAAINGFKEECIERIGAECAACDVPFFLELVAYHDQLDSRSREFALLKPETVSEGIGEFSKPRYAVDVLKVGLPVNVALVEGASSDGIYTYTRQEAKAHLVRAARMAKKPFIYLSEGVSNELFSFALALAAEAKVNYSGVLCGRATWKDGVPVFVQQGGKALEAWLAEFGVRNIQNVNAQLQAATPWFSFDGSSPAPEAQ